LLWTKLYMIHEPFCTLPFLMCFLTYNSRYQRFVTEIFSLVVIFIQCSLIELPYMHSYGRVIIYSQIDLIAYLLPGLAIYSYIRLQLFRIPKIIYPHYFLRNSCKVSKSAWMWFLAVNFYELSPVHRQCFV
jgi:hypothetical protein